MQKILNNITSSKWSFLINTPLIPNPVSQNMACPQICACHCSICPSWATPGGQQAPAEGRGCCSQSGTAAEGRSCCSLSLGHQQRGEAATLSVCLACTSSRGGILSQDWQELSGAPVLNVGSCFSSASPKSAGRQVQLVLFNVRSFQFSF